MTVFDAIVLVVVLGGAIRGGFRGFTYEALTLLSWVFAVLALRLFHAPVTAWMADSLGAGDGAPVLAFALLFAAAFFGSRFVGRKLGIGVRESFVGPFDRMLGVGFGALKGLVGVTLLFLLVNLALDIAYGGGTERPAWLTESRSYPLLNASGRAIIDFVEYRQSGGGEEAAEEA